MDLVFKYIEDFLLTALWKYCIKYISYQYKVSMYLQLVRRINFVVMGELRWRTLYSYAMVFFLYTLKIEKSPLIEHYNLEL